MPHAGTHLLVFRDGRRSVAGRTPTLRLASELRRLSSAPSRDEVVSALLLAGELECALADAATADAALVAAISDALAALLVTRSPEPHPSSFVNPLDCIEPPAQLEISTPEGFAYYALHPLDYAAAVQHLPQGSRVAVVGIRSIGVTLSAVVAAAFANRGAQSQRMTVRPQGHPYDRHVQWTSEQRRWIAVQCAHHAEFVVVDEGPGLSGSSFLSVGEALIEAGVPPAAITFLCSHQPDLDALIARDASTRWRQFRCIAADRQVCLPEGEYVGGGEWRRLWFRDAAGYPASWTTMERYKVLSPGRQTIFKFQGLGHYGAELLRRERALSDFAAIPQDSQDGFALYQVASFTPMTSTDLSAEVIDRLASYCAFRASALATEPCSPQPLESMVRFNVRQLLGTEIDLPDGALRAERPVIADGRMQPHEWLRTSTAMLKTDAGGHGDDHFFPGPTDIAWDLAAAIVEWEMDASAQNAFLNSYRQLAHDDPRPRLPQFLLAYSIFRAAYCAMAAHATRGAEEHDRLCCASSAYCSAAARYAQFFLPEVAHLAAG